MEFAVLMIFGLMIIGGLGIISQIYSVMNNVEEEDTQICEYCGKEFVKKGHNKRCPECVRADLGKEIIEDEW